MGLKCASIMPYQNTVLDINFDSYDFTFEFQVTIS